VQPETALHDSNWAAFAVISAGYIRGYPNTVNP
jgi:hypothetical protein